MPTYKELVDSTKCEVHGIVKGVQDYVKPDTQKHFFSVDLDVKGSKQIVNVRLPDGFPILSLKEYELVKLRCDIGPAFGGKGLQLTASSLLP